MTVPESELNWSYARSGGPGGQNVNKVSSKAILRWKLVATAAIPEYVKTRIGKLFPSRLTEAGEIVISSQEHRDQEMNRQACLEKLESMIVAASKLPKPRAKTKPSKASNQRRLVAKKHASKRRNQRIVEKE
jgi:ribosome-associated protein